MMIGLHSLYRAKTRNEPLPNVEHHGLDSRVSHSHFSWAKQRIRFFLIVLPHGSFGVFRIICAGSEIRTSGTEKRLHRGNVLPFGPSSIKVGSGNASRPKCVAVIRNMRSQWIRPILIDPCLRQLDGVDIYVLHASFLFR